MKKKGIICLLSLDDILNLVEAEILTEEDAEYYTLEDIEDYKTVGFNFFEYDPKQISLFELID